MGIPCYRIPPLLAHFAMEQEKNKAEAVKDTKKRNLSNMMAY